MTTAEAKVINDRFEECKKRAHYFHEAVELYRKENGVLLNATVVNLVMTAKDTLARRGKNPGDVRDRESGAS